MSPWIRGRAAKRRGRIVAEKPRRKPPAKPRKKKPWESPRVKSGRLFESNSLACGKNQTTGDHDMCAADPLMS
jgi:hypothetical protein